MQRRGKWILIESQASRQRGRSEILETDTVKTRFTLPLVSKGSRRRRVGVAMVPTGAGQLAASVAVKVAFAAAGASAENIFFSNRARSDRHVHSCLSEPGKRVHVIPLLGFRELRRPSLVRLLRSCVLGRTTNDGRPTHEDARIHCRAVVLQVDACV